MPPRPLLRASLALILALASSSALFGQAASRIQLDLDTASAVAVVDAFERGSVSDEDLEAMLALPGVQGLIAQAARFDDEATPENFARSLRAALAGEEVSPDPFRFAVVRERFERIAPTVAWIEANRAELAADLARRIGAYSALESELRVPVYMVVGGSSDGWANGRTFHIALHYFQDDMEGLRLIMAHELYHVAQSGFVHELTVTESEPALRNVERLLSTSLVEGSASLLSWPAEGLHRGVYTDEWLTRKLELNRRRARDVFALFDALVIALRSDPALDFGSVYNLGFSGTWESPFYYLGYHVARTVEEVRGRAALVDLLARPAVELFQAYVSIYRERDHETLPRFRPSVEAILDEVVAHAR